MTIVDLTTGIAGAYCTKLLSDLGYDVVKTVPPGNNAFEQFLARHKRLDPNADLATASVLVMDSTGLAGCTSQELAGHTRTAVVTTITPFGLDTPWSDKPATEFTLQAWSGGMIGLGRGYADRAPVHIGGQVGEFMAGLYAAIGTLISLARGGGELVDVSMLEAMALCLTYYPVSYFDMVGRPFRTGRAPVTPGVESASDGLVGVGVGTGQQWLDFCVMVGHPEWQEDRKLFANRTHLAPEIAAWMAQHTVDEILELAAAFRIPHAPIGNGETIPETDHFVARGSIVDGAPVPPWRFTPPLPATGSGSDGFSYGSRTSSEELLFDGLRVVDLTAFWAGPLCTHVLALLGAEVIHIESTRRPDGTRLLAGMRGEQWWERSGIFSGLNTNKKSVTLDLTTERGRALLQRLVDTADIVVENFTPRVMDQLGLDLSRSDLITVRMPGFGLDGPWRDNPAFAFVIEDAAGLTWRTGYADRNPLSPYTVGDPNAGLHALAGLLRALEHRAATADGMTIEAAMVDAALNVGAEQIVEYAASGTLLVRDAGRNLYLTAEEDTWVAIESDDDLTDWCATRQADEIVAAMWARGVPAAKVSQPHEQADLPPLQARGFFENVTHPVTGAARHSGLPIKFSNGPAQLHRRHAPLLGEHNGEVLRGLGLSDDDLATLEADGVIGRTPAT
jgi:crotonobetainyl-CoA:carnitine CoA-transferase CaiB-like acyl-CoA transferase